MPQLVNKPTKTTSTLRSARAQHRASTATSVWTGPCGGGDNGGVTFSTLSRYLSCRERFRLHMVEGLRVQSSFRAPIEYGNMWHACEEALASKKAHFGEVVGTALWEDNLTAYCKKLCVKYPLQQDQVDHWYSMARAQFPHYVKHWAEHPDVKSRIPLMQEQKFDVPYKLPSGRCVRLRGKWDSVDLIEGALWIQENKTKSSVDHVKVARQMRFDLQTMLYFIALLRHQSQALNEHQKVLTTPVHGVRYNVVRRSAHKTPESMLKKLEEDRDAGRIGEWFARWSVAITQDDVQKFMVRCLVPLLENACDDFEWWDRCITTHGDVYDFKMRRKEFPDHQNRHYVTPFGVYDPVKEGGSSDLDEYLESGSEVGLRRVEVLFEELAA